MTQQTRKTILLPLGAALMFGMSACLIDDSINNFSSPEANAGEDQKIVYDGKPVTVKLDGSKSKDTDRDGEGKIVRYQWQANNPKLKPMPAPMIETDEDAGAVADAGVSVSAPMGESPDPKDIAKPTVVLGEGTWKFTLWVTDDDDQVSEPDSVTITIEPTP